MSEAEVHVIERTTPYRGYMRLDHYKLKHKIFDQGWSIELSREVLERGQCVGLLPYDPERDEVVLLEQFRIGGYTSPDASPWQIECVAGMIEPGHFSEETALRETEEEAGVQVTELEPMHHYLTSPGCTSESLELFCGCVDTEGVGGIFGLAEEGEYIRVFVVPAEEAFAMLDRGEIGNAMTIIALQWLKLHHTMMREKWQLNWTAETSVNQT